MAVADDEAHTEFSREHRRPLVEVLGNAIVRRSTCHSDVAREARDVRCRAHRARLPLSDDELRSQALSTVAVESPRGDDDVIPSAVRLGLWTHGRGQGETGPILALEAVGFVTVES